MIIGNPTIEAVTELLETEGCPECGQVPGWIDIDAPGRLVPSCGHAVHVNELQKDGS